MYCTLSLHEQQNVFEVNKQPGTAGPPIRFELIKKFSLCKRKEKKKLVSLWNIEGGQKAYRQKN